jgi:uncharacterized protein YcbX
VAITVIRLAITAVKGLRLREVPKVDLDRRGALGDRAFYLIDERDRMVNGKQLGELQTVVADYDRDARRLALSFPGGSVVTGPVEPGPTVLTRFYSRPLEARLLGGPWAAALSEHVGRPLRLVEPEIAIDRGLEGATSLISTASLHRLAREAGQERVDPRRFRMLIEVDGIEAHEEDGWVGRTLTVGAARLRFNGHIGRCLITSRDPETGVVDLPTLDVLGAYRRDVPSTEPLPFGIYGQVLEAGAVSVGDAVAFDR